MMNTKAVALAAVLAQTAAAGVQGADAVGDGKVEELKRLMTKPRPSQLQTQSVQSTNRISVGEVDSQNPNRIVRQLNELDFGPYNSRTERIAKTTNYSGSVTHRESEGGFYLFGKRVFGGKQSVTEGPVEITPRDANKAQIFTLAAGVSIKLQPSHSVMRNTYSVGCEIIEGSNPLNSIIVSVAPDSGSIEIKEGPGKTVVTVLERHLFGNYRVKVNHVPLETISPDRHGNITFKLNNGAKIEINQTNR